MKLMKRNSSLGEEDSILDPKVVNGLLTFKEMSATRKFLCEVLSFTLQPGQLTGLHEEFEKMDVSGKGEISLAGFKAALLARSDDHRLSENEIEEIFNGLKVRNTDLSIRWHEFIAACLSQCHVDDRNIRLAFDRLDTEHKGYITLKDLKYAMDFYGSDARVDLQNMWINNIIDYKSEKEHMTYEDFHKLLKLDIQSVSPELTLSKSVLPQPQRMPYSRLRSSVGNDAAAFDEDVLNDFCLPIDETSVENDGRVCRRHSLGSVYDLDMGKILKDGQEPALITSMKAYRNLHDFILEASKRVEKDKKSKVLRRISLSSSKGLLVRRESQEPR